MSIFTSLSIVVISMLIIASLKLVPGVFGLFYHYALGKYSARKVSDLSIFFIFGVEILPALIFILLNLILFALSFTAINLSSEIFSWTMAGLLIALGFAYFCFYFRSETGTKLFISRRSAANFEQKAKLVKNRSDAFILGFVSGIPELIFSLPLYLLVLISVTKDFAQMFPPSLIIAPFILITICPLFFVYAYFRSGNNLANFLKLRIKNKLFFRLFTSILYLLLAILIIFFRIIL